ncbi:hypothetical protein LLL80_004469 [Salmonella enterica subsp. enterica serovar Give]|nr:hypothetical protein [Salmonella enterica subsp. enterica serovar Give]EIL4257976.1 hypothetical protein [Salmonella enterica subsp. enterica serovar Give]
MTGADLLNVLSDIAGTAGQPERKLYTDWSGVVADVLQRENHDLNGQDLLHLRTRAAAILAPPSTPATKRKRRPLPVEEAIAAARKVKKWKNRTNNQDPGGVESVPEPGHLTVIPMP